MQPHRSTRLARTSIFVALGMALGACGTDSADPKDAGFTQTDSSIMGDDSCDGQAIGSTERRVRYQAASVKSDAECMKQDQLRTCQDDGMWSVWSGDYTVETCKVESMASCDGMPHGTMQTRPRYETMTVANGSTCKKQDQTRACENGAWSAWSGNFTFEMCTVDGATSCDGKPDSTKEERTRYETLTVPFGSECKLPEKQTRECKKGTWSAWTGTFKEENCRVLEAMSCGHTPHLGTETQTRWKASLVEANETCQSEEQKRTCTNGKFGEWTGSFTEVRCEVKGKRSCGETPHGSSEKQKLYESAVVEFGAECKSVEQTRVCKDGTFEAWTPASTFAAISCKPKDPLPCGTVAHGVTRTRPAFKDATPKFGTTCESELQTGTCNNGNWSDYVQGPLKYSALTCTVQAPANCGAVAHGKTTTRTYYQKASVDFGTTCKSELQTGTCFDGTLTFNGTYTAPTCVIAPAEPCDASPSGTVEKRDRFEKPSVAAGAKCVKEVQSRTCTNKKWSAWTGTYTELACKVRGRDCSNPTIVDGASESRVRYEASFPEATCKAETQTRLCTDGTFKPWNGTFKSVACAAPPTTGTGVVSCRESNDTNPKCREWRGTNLAGYKSQCNAAGAVWDTTHGCPVEGTTIGKCSGTVAATTTNTIAEFFYEGNATFEATTCGLLLRTWTAL